MKKIAIIICCLYSINNLKAQDSSIQKKIFTYKLKITDIEQNEIKGLLSGFTDSSIIVFSLSNVTKKSAINQSNSSQIKFNRIQSINFRRKGRTGRSMLLGGLAGLGFGGIMGAIKGEESHISQGGTCQPPAGTRVVDVTAEQNVVKYSAVGLFYGAIGGGIFGLFPEKHFAINGSKNSFTNMKEFMMKKLYR